MRRLTSITSPVHTNPINLCVLRCSLSILSHLGALCLPCLFARSLYPYLCPISHHDTEEEVALHKEEFDVMDKDQNGILSREELADAAKDEEVSPDGAYTHTHTRIYVRRGR